MPPSKCDYIALPHEDGFWKTWQHDQRSQEMRGDRIYMNEWAHYVLGHFLDARGIFHTVSVESGRGPGKSKGGYDIGHGAARSLRSCLVLYMREFEKQLEATRRGFEDWMVERGCWDEYRWTRNEVTHRQTGALIQFRGIEKKKSSLKGVEPRRNTLAIWDEAQDVSDESMTLFEPSLHRVPNALQLFFWNPRNPGDPVARRYQHKKVPGVLTVRTNWRFNPWHNMALERIRLKDLEENPEEYDWTWEGDFYPDTGSNRVLPMTIIDAASRAMGSEWCPNLSWEHMDSPVVMGVDSAHTGKTGFCVRRGPLVKHLAAVYCGHGTRDAVREAHKLMQFYGVSVIYYDASAASADFGPMAEEMSLRQGLDWGDCKIVPVPFTTGVSGPGVEYQGEETNSQAFHRLPDQLAIAARIRMQNTANLEHGVCRHGIKSCLVFDPELVRDPHKWQWARIEMNQPMIERTGANKIQIEKGEPSPDMFDSLRVSLREDVDRGLKADSEHLATALV